MFVTGVQVAYAVGNAERLQVVSSRSDTVSGGDALVKLDAVLDSDSRVSLNGRDVTASFRRSESGEWLAVLTGLQIGKNTVELQKAGVPRSSIDLVNHSLGGPIFSGPHQTPFICETQDNGLGPALDADCSAHTIVQYYYKSTAPAVVDTSTPLASAPSLYPGFKIYDPSVPPRDVANTLTSDGHTVPYIVRREVGTINRAVYDIEFLHQPGQPLPTPWKPGTVSWNGRLIYFVGGGCGSGYRQGRLLGPVGAAGQPFLEQGYATANATLNIAGTNCDAYLSAETLSMVKEHFIKSYGKPVYTIGWGESGGSYNQFLTAQNYPGLLDGLIAAASFPDFFTSIQSFADCAGLYRAFSVAQQDWSEMQKTAVSGFSSWQTCIGKGSDGKPAFAPMLNPVKYCPPLIPPDTVYNRTTRPRGLRCDLYQTLVNILGRDSRTGFANRLLDNVGVQYGLLAFNRGQITAEQFVELNEHVGGFDNDNEMTASREAADPSAVSIAYQRGVVLTGGGGLNQVPIIDWRQYLDDLSNNHDSVRSLMTRARLLSANGNADNDVILTFPRWTPQDIAFFLSVRRWEVVYPEQSRYLVRQMDLWLHNISADTATGSLAAKVVRDKPKDLVDGCWTTAGERIAEIASFDARGRCNREYPVHADPRMAAGGPLRDDILKCALKPVRRKDYSKPLADAQLARLQAVFPTGVCDYSKPGIGQGPIASTWQSY